MRKLIVCNIMSLDGYFEGPDENVMLLPMDGPSLRLLETRRRDGSSNLLVRYEVLG
jgi:hypothetical protein